MPVTAHRAAAERTLRLTILAWAGVWLLSFAPVLLSSPPWTIAPAVTVGLVLSVAVAWLLTAATGLPAGRALVPVLGVTAATQAWLTSQSALVDNQAVLASWNDVAAICAAFAYTGWRAPAAVAAMVGAQAVILTGRSIQADILASSWPTVAEVVAYGLATGLAAGMAARTVRGAADATDAAETDLALRRQQAAAKQAHSDEADRITRVLHETVINTLGALRRGLPPGEHGRGRTRCAQDLARLAALSEEPGSVDSPGDPPPRSGPGGSAVPPPAPDGDADPAVRASLARTTLGICVPPAVLCAVLTAVSWPAFPSPSSLPALVVLAAVLGLLAALGLRQQRVPLPAWAAAVLICAIPLITMLPAFGASGCIALSHAWWGPIGGLVPLLGLALATTGWWWTGAGAAVYALATASVLAGQQQYAAQCAATHWAVLVLNLGVAAALVLFRNSLRRLWAQAAAANREATTVAIDVAVAAAQERARRARLAGVRATTIPLLEGVESGTLDLDDPVVRQRCGLEEEALRGLMQIDPGSGWLGDDLAAAVLQAHASGRQIRITAASAVPLPDRTARPLLRDTLHHAISALPDAGTATLALLPTGEDGGELMLVSDIAPATPDRDADHGEEPHVTAGLDIGRESLDGQELMWIRWPA